MAASRVSTYSVDTSSKFAFFLDEDANLEADPEDILEKVRQATIQERAQAQQVKKAAKKHPASNSQTANSAPIINPSEVQSNQSIGITNVKNRQESGQQIKTGRSPRNTQQSENANFPSNTTGTKDFSEGVETTAQHIDRPRGGMGNRGSSYVRGGGSNRGLGPRRVDFNNTPQQYPGNNQQEFVPNNNSEYYQRDGSFQQNNRGAGNFTPGRGRYRGGQAGGRGRTFDRQSGSAITGVKHVDKRGGSGRNNWGNPEDDVQGIAPGQPIPDEQIDNVLATPIEEVVPVQDSGVAVNPLEERNDLEQLNTGDPAGNDSHLAAATNDENREPDQLTLEEYLAKRDNLEGSRLEALHQCLGLAQQKSKKHQYELRPGNDKEFAGMTLYVKQDLQAANEPSSDEEAAQHDVEDTSRGRRTIEIAETRYGSRGGSGGPRRNAGGRGGGGGGPGYYRGGGGGRGAHPMQRGSGIQSRTSHNVNLLLENKEEFPDLI